VTTEPGNASLDARPGQAVYSTRVLRIYDALVLNVAYPLGWGCPSGRIQRLYNDHVSSDHLDVGVGTGYFLNRCRFPTPAPRLALVDMNSNSLAMAAHRLRRYSPTTHVTNVLERIDLSPESYRSVSMTNLLHCLPGSLRSKSAALANAKALMRPGAVLFGSTVIGTGIRHNLLGRTLLASWNRRGIYSNLDDDLSTLESVLTDLFARHEVSLHGPMALFTAWV
jgi:hypothetical protein